MHLKSLAATEATWGGTAGLQGCSDAVLQRGLPGNKLSASCVMVTKHFMRNPHWRRCRMTQNLNPVVLWGDFQPLEVKVARKFSLHLKHRRKNVKRRQAVSHAALRDDSGHGCESEVKAITSWVAPLSDL